MNKTRFKKVVRNIDDFTTSEDIFYGSMFGLILWITCLLWFPFYWFIYQLPKIVKENREVYYEEIKEKQTK